MMPLAYGQGVGVQTEATSPAGRQQDQPTVKDIANPSLQSGAYQAMLPDWHLLHTVYEGTRSMRLAGKIYLPQYARESEAEYDRRLQATTLTNMLRLAVLHAVGRPFAKPVQISDSSSVIVAEWAKDVDLEGHDINVWGRRAFREALLDGMVHALADHITVPNGVNAKEFMDLGGGRPYLSLVPAQMLIAAYTDIINGVKRCVHARIREYHTYLEGFRETRRERIRVLEPGFYTLWENGPSGWVVIEEGSLIKANGQAWEWVPLETFYAGTSDTDYVVTPPFIDLAYKNVEHWQSTSDQRNILTKGRFPMLAASGVDPNTVLDASGALVVGPHTALLCEDVGGKWYYVEPGGAAITAGREDLSNLMNDMRLLAMDPTQTGDGKGVTATGKTLDEAKARAPLEVWARDFAGFLENCFHNMFEWLSLEGGIAKIELNTDFGLDIADQGELSTLTQLRAMGDITRSTLYAELKRRQVLADSFDPELEEANLEVQAALLPGFGGADPNDPAGEFSDDGGGDPALSDPAADPGAEDTGDDTGSPPAKSKRKRKRRR